MSTWNRQKSLWDSRGLLCNCERCLDPTEFGTNLNTLKCLKCRADVLPVNLTRILQSDWKCLSACGEIYPAQYVRTLITPIYSQVQGRRHSMWRVPSLEELLRNMSKVIHSNNYSCIHIRTYLYDAYGSPQKEGLMISKHCPVYSPLYTQAAGSKTVDQLSDEELERKAELCQQVLDVIAHPRFERSDGTLETCLTQLALSKKEIAKRKRETGVWDEQRTQQSLRRKQSIVGSCCEPTASSVGRLVEPTRTSSSERHWASLF